MKMFTLLIVCGLIAVSNGALPRIRPSVPMLDGRIVGGTQTEIEEYPYQLSVQYFRSHICGGSLISSQHVLTAAHCTDGMLAYYMFVRGGSTDYRKGGQYSRVKSLAQHPNFTTTTLDFDVSVLLLLQPFTSGIQLQLIKLQPVHTSIKPGTQCIITGWGLDNEQSKTLSSVLRVVNVPVIQDETCQAAYEDEGGITDRMMCCGYVQGGKDACQGDSGGPLVYNGSQIGIVSWGVGCADPKFPGVYTKIWNEEITKFIIANSVANAYLL